MFDPFPVIYEDERLIAVNKPSGIMVHRSRISEDKIFVLQLLRDQIGQRVFPVHRLDRGTSGLLLFAKDSETASMVGQQFQTQQIDKTYLAIVRGYLPPRGTIEYALSNRSLQEAQNAITHYRRLQQTELDVAIGRYASARYSLIEAKPETGKFHQIRRHFSHIRHPIIGDKKHGDVKHNNYWRDHWDIGRLLLHASDLSFTHPCGERLALRAVPTSDFVAALKHLSFTVTSNKQSNESFLGSEV